MAKLMRINPDNPAQKDIHAVCDALLAGALIVYPTDTVYALGCDMTNYKAVERLAALKKVKAEKANFATIFHDLSHLSDFTRPIDNHTFRLMKKALPGPFTFILEAGGNLPKHFKKKKEIGIRVPDHMIPREIVRVLGNPLITTSIHDEDELIEYPSDPSLILDMMDGVADLMIDGGYGNNIASTVVDLRGGEAEVLRQGLGDIDQYL